MSTKDFSAAVTDALRGQYRAALATLEQSILSSSEDTWQADHLDGPPDRVVFHVLIFTDIYLDWGEDVFRTQDFHVQNPGFFRNYEELEDVIPVNHYSRKDCLAYLEHCRNKVDRVLNEETEEDLQGDCGYPRRNLNRLGLHIYNIRHIQHHAAQLGLRRQLDGGEALRWIGRD